MNRPTLSGMIQIGVTSLSNGSFFYFSNKYTGFLGSQNRSNQEEFRLEPSSELYDNEYNTSMPGFIPTLGHIPRYISKPKPGLKYHFYNLKYYTEEERKVHE